MVERNENKGPPETAGPDSSGLLTKTMLTEEVSLAVNLRRKEAAFIVECILDNIVHALHRGDRVEIRGFGSFRTRQRRARVGRNPKTGARVEVPAKRIAFLQTRQGTSRTG